MRKIDRIGILLMSAALAAAVLWPAGSLFAEAEATSEAQPETESSDDAQRTRSHGLLPALLLMASVWSLLATQSLLAPRLGNAAAVALSFGAATALVLAPHLEGVDPTTVSSWERTESAVESGSAPPSLVAPIEIEEDAFGLMELLDARALRARGRTDEAIQALQRNLYRDPNDTGSRRELAEIYRERGELQEALSELSILLWTEPSAEAHVRLARVYLEMQDPGKAVEEVKKALELDPEHAGARGLRTEIAQP